MKFILLIALFSVYLSQVLSKSTSESKSIEDDLLDPTKILGDLTKNGTNILDLDIDSMFLIFDKLGTIKLMTLSEIQPFLPVIQLILVKRFKKLSITIGGGKIWNRDSSGKYLLEDMTEYKNDITIERFPEAAAVLNSFGHLIKYLIIQKFNGWSRTSIKQILTLINSNCAETLKKIDFIDTEHDIFGELTTPFKISEQVELMSESGYKNLNSSDFSFGERFPVSRSIILDSHITSNTDPKNYVMPHLEHIKSRFEDKDLVKFNDTLFGMLIKNNPQIKNIIVTYCNAGMLKFLSNEAPNLEYLEFYYLYDRYDNEFTDIRFEKLKKLKIGGHFMPPRFICDNLEELLASASVTFDDLLSFISNRTSLKKLEFDLGAFSNEQILSLASINLSITEATFYSKYDVKAENIIQFIGSCQNLKKLETSIVDHQYKMILINDLTRLLPNFDNEWTIKVNRVILLEKKF